MAPVSKLENKKNARKKSTTRQTSPVPQDDEFAQIRKNNQELMSIKTRLGYAPTDAKEILVGLPKPNKYKDAAKSHALLAKYRRALDIIKRVFPNTGRGLSYTAAYCEWVFYMRKCTSQKRTATPATATSPT